MGREMANLTILEPNIGRRQLSCAWRPIQAKKKTTAMIFGQKGQRQHQKQRCGFLPCSPAILIALGLQGTFAELSTKVGDYPRQRKLLSRPKSSKLSLQTLYQFFFADWKAILDRLEEELNSLPDFGHICRQK